MSTAHFTGIPMEEFIEMLELYFVDNALNDDEFIVGITSITIDTDFDEVVISFETEEIEVETITEFPNDNDAA